jgi:hypothetical protein
VTPAAAAAATLPGCRCQAVAPGRCQAVADSHRPRGALVLRSALDGLVDAFVRVHVGEVLNHLGLRAVRVRRACVRACVRAVSTHSACGVHTQCVRCPHTVRAVSTHSAHATCACGVPCAGPFAGRVSRSGRPMPAAPLTVEGARPRSGGSGWAARQRLGRQVRRPVHPRAAHPPVPPSLPSPLDSMSHPGPACAP